MEFIGVNMVICINRSREYCTWALGVTQARITLRVVMVQARVHYMMLFLMLATAQAQKAFF